MRTYRKRFKVSETSPVQVGDTWTVTEKGKAAEKWVVTKVNREYYIAEITEYFRTGDAPRPKE